MSERKAFEHFAIDKENFESYLGDDITISDEEWEKVCDALEHSVGEFIDNDLSFFVQEYKYELRKDN